MKGRVLIVAGSDSGGGAGIQADIKTVTALGGYAMTAITALTAQNTEGVFGIHDTPPHIVAQQMEVVLDDIGADCIKIGMLHRPNIINAVADVINAHSVNVPVVVDPVMVAKGGAPLLAKNAINTLKERLVPMASLLTPNLPEAEILTGTTLSHEEFGEELASMLLSLGPEAVLLKGGHREGEEVQDLLMGPDGNSEIYKSPRIDTVHTHGTGCTLASAIATGLAQGIVLRDAVSRARNYVIEAIKSAPGLGRGHGPLNHTHTMTEF